MGMFDKEEEIVREAVSDRQSREAFKRDSGHELARETNFEKCQKYVASRVRNGAVPSRLIGEVVRSYYPDELIAEALRHYRLRGQSRYFLLALLRGKPEWWGPGGFRPEAVGRELTYDDMKQVVMACKNQAGALRMTPILALPYWDTFWEVGIQGALTRRRPDFMLAWDTLKKSRRGVVLGDRSRACRMSLKGYRRQVHNLFRQMTEYGPIHDDPAMPDGAVLSDGWAMIGFLESGESVPMTLTRNRREFLMLYAHFRGHKAAARARRRALAAKSAPIVS